MPSNIPGWVYVIVIGIVLAAAGVVVISSGSNIPAMNNAGWIFAIGGFVIIGLGIRSAMESWSKTRIFKKLLGTSIQ